MSDDLPKRLRELAAAKHDDLSIAADAAAEIERLRAAIATARNDALEKAALCLPRYEHSRDDLAQIISDMQDRIRSLKSKGAGDE